MRRIVSLLLLILLHGCGSPSGHQRRSDVEPLPELDLTGAEVSVQKQLETKRSELMEQLQDPDVGSAELGEAFADLGLLYMTYEFLDSAGACFRNARNLSSDDFRWHYLLGYLEMTRGNLPRAVELYEEALALEPKFLPAVLRLGRCRLDLALYEESTTTFEHALEISPNIAAAYEGLAKSAAALGRHEEAVDHFERALTLEPDADSLHYALGQSYRNLGRLEEARDHLARSGDVGTQIIDPLISPMASLAESVQFYTVQGAEAMDDGRYEDAAAAYRAAIERDETNFRSYRGLGVSLQHIGDLKGASEAFQTAVDKGATGSEEEDAKERAGMLRALAGIAALQGRQSDTLERYLQSLAEAPDQPDVLLLAGNALARASRFAEAVDHYDRLIQLEPEWESALLEKRATALVNLGRGEEAIDDFEQAVAAAPKERALRLRFAEALEYLGQSARAARERAAAEGLSVSDTERAAARTEAARQAIREENFDQAIREFRRALEILPGDHATRFSLASVLGHQRQFAEAAAEFEQIIADSPRHDGARRGQIGAFIMSGRYGEARVKLQEALKTFPRHAGFALIQVRLLSTAPDPSVRDGNLALQIAELLHAESDEVAIRQALALAYAAAGRFADAAALQRKILAEDEAGGEMAYVRLGRARLSAFEAGKVWVAEDPIEILVP
jgi:superkiller protein 3